jgi:hypothetical protein
MITSDKKRVFTLELEKGSTPTDMCRLIHTEAFAGSTPDGPEFSDGIHRHTRVLTLADAAAICNADVAAGTGHRPICEYVDSI